MVIYLDCNASAPINSKAEQELYNCIKNIGNPSSTHLFGRILRSKLDFARTKVAQILDADSKEVVFNSGSTEGNIWLLSAVINLGLLNNKPCNVLTTPLEHPSLLKPLQRANEKGLINLSLLQLANENLVYDEKLILQADVIFATAAHHETGLIINWQKIIDNSSTNGILIADIAQAVARMPPVPKRIDALVCSAHKIGGPPGCGALVLRGNAKNLPPSIFFGGQENGLRPGTEAWPLILSFGAAASIIEQTRSDYQKLKDLRDLFENLIKDAVVVKIIAENHLRLTNTSALMFDKVDGEALRIALDAAEVCVGFGSACSSLAPEPSFALLKMGLTTNQAKATIRVSLYPGITKEIIFEAAKRIIKVIKALQL